MSTSTQPRSKRIRTRTFTGCLTCRRRKVKCDEARPTCAACNRVGVICQGYQTKLNWITNVDHGRTSISRTGSPGRRGNASHGRRNMSTDASRRAMSAEMRVPFQNLDIRQDINLAIQNLHKESTDLPGSVAQSDSRTEGPFGVFQLSSTESITNTQSRSRAEAESVGNWEDIPNSMDDIFETDLNDPFVEGTSPEADFLRDFQLSLFNQDMPDLTGLEWPGGSMMGTPRPESRASGISVHTRHSQDDPLWMSTLQVHSDNFSRTTSPPLCSSTHSFDSQIPKDVRLLLNHYVTHVVSAMSAIPLNETPWTTIHVPCAMKAIGEMSIYGEANYAKTSLLHSLLAISAHHLDAKYTESGGGSRWSGIARAHTRIAQVNLRMALQAGVGGTGPKAVRYKELLMALMTVVATSIVSGQMRRTHFYLLQAESLIRRHGHSQSASKKVSILHQTFSFVRVIDATTFTHSLNQYRDILLLDSSESDPIDLDSVSRSDPQVWQDESATRSNLPPEYGSSDSIYGVSSSLLTLMAQTTNLAEQLEGFHTEHPDLAVPRNLADKCALIEERICKWAIPSEAGQSGTVISNAYQCISSAMHHALLIYFFRRIRNTNPIILQHYVESVIDFLLAHERIQDEHDIKFGAIVWPGFIAACEAIGTDLRQKCLERISHAGECGFRNYEMAIVVVKEVWRRRDEVGGGYDASWVDVVKDLQCPLVLT